MQKKIQELDIPIIIGLYKSGHKYSEICKRFGVTKERIRQIVLREIKIGKRDNDDLMFWNALPQIKQHFAEGTSLIRISEIVGLPYTFMTVRLYKYKINLKKSRANKKCNEFVLRDGKVTRCKKPVHSKNLCNTHYHHHLYNTSPAFKERILNYQKAYRKKKKEKAT